MLKALSLKLDEPPRIWVEGIHALKLGISFQDATIGRIETRPHESVLSQVLFFTHTFNLPPRLDVRSQLKAQMYADDTEIHAAYNSGNKTQVCQG